jgi:hypothetical protein
MMEPATNIDDHHLPPVRLPKGFVLGGYVVDGWLRDGGMASIYRARRVCDDRRVALKLQLPATAHDAMICARFDREAEVMRRATHNPHVVELYDADVLADGRRYFLMEWVEGENLEDLLDFLRNQDQRLAIVRACRIGRDVARGLSELHEHGVLHLDLKPANVMVGRGVDGRDEIKLVDFGVAADLHEIEPEPHAVPVMGTTGYMAPEQLHGEPPNPSFDVYALGVLMFESIAGTSVPPDGWTPDTLPRVETRRRGVPKQLADLVHACMDFDPTRRPTSPRKVASELVRIIVALETEGRRGKSDAGAGMTPAQTGTTQVVPHSSAVRGEVVRTGGTDVTPRSELLMEAPARTGGTEVVLIEELLARNAKAPARPSDVHPAGTSDDAGALRDVTVPQIVVPMQAAEELRARKLVDVTSAKIDARSVLTPVDEAGTPLAERVDADGAAQSASRSPKALQDAEAVSDELGDGDSQGTGSIEAWEDEDEPRTHGWLRWATLGAAAAVVVAMWIGRDGRSGDDSISAASEGTRNGTSMSTMRATGTDQEAEAAGAPREQQNDLGAKPVLAGQDESPEAMQSEPGVAKVAAEPRAAGADADMCRKTRMIADEATQDRAWRKVLRMTDQRGCWTSTTHRRARKRLRVQAYAELGDFRKCVTEAGESTDVKITSRVGYCMNGLRAG